MFRDPLSLSAAAICLLCAACSVAATKGVHPDKLHLYEDSNGSFRCFDGRLTIPIGRVNDDFCDCEDGSDEPGTSACPNGEFYCRNRGHTGKTLSSSFVNDGVCDCCDGSDEERGCNNYCAALGSAVLKEKKELLAEHSAGAELRASLLRDAAIRRESWQQQEALLMAKIEQLRPVVAGLLGVLGLIQNYIHATIPTP